LEDKVVQHAVGAVLNQIWEEDFLDFSYGFRAGRSQHDALDALYVGIKRKKATGLSTWTSGRFWIQLHIAPWLMKVSRKAAAAGRQP
jgi:retron-type reverse transcriptase